MTFRRTTRVTLWTPITSFRDPFVVIGMQPSHDIPPPSTIYGLCCNVAGAQLDPAAFFFGIHFVFQAKGTDHEHQHIAKAATSLTKTWVDTPHGPRRATMDVVVQPVDRELLFGVTTTLYLDTELAQAFRRPANIVTLGRSQDLTHVVDVMPVTLEKPRVHKVRFENTLLPRSIRPCIRYGTTALLSRYITSTPERDVAFDQFIVLHEPVFLGDDEPGARDFTLVDSVSLDDLYCDTSMVDERGFARAVWLHRLL